MCRTMIGGLFDQMGMMMLVFVCFWAVLTLVMWLVPDAPAARFLHRYLVKLPLHSAAKLERHHLLFVLIITGLMIAGGEAFAIIGPEFVAAYAIDMAIYLDAVLVTYALSAASQARSTIGWTMGAYRKLLRRPQALRRKRRRTDGASGKKPANDDANDHDGHPAFRRHGGLI